MFEIFHKMGYCWVFVIYFIPQALQPKAAWCHTQPAQRCQVKNMFEKLMRESEKSIIEP